MSDVKRCERLVSEGHKTMRPNRHARHCSLVKKTELRNISAADRESVLHYCKSPPQATGFRLKISEINKTKGEGLASEVGVGRSRSSS